MHAAPPALARLFDQSAAGISSPPPQECACPLLCSRASARGLAPACSWPLPRAPLQLINYSRARCAAGAGSLCRITPPPAPVARTPKAGGPDSAPATPRHPSGLCLGASGTVLCRGTLCLTSTTPWHPDTPYAAGSACHPTAPHSVLVVVAGPGTRSAGGFCARSTQRGLHLVRCCWGGPALGVTKHSTDRHVPGQGGSGDRAGAPRGHTARCWQCKALPAAAPACRGAQVQAAQGTMHTHPNTRTPCWLGCTDTWLHRRTHRGGQRRAHTHTQKAADRRMDAEVHKHMRRQTHRYTHRHIHRITNTLTLRRAHMGPCTPVHTHSYPHKCTHPQGNVTRTQPWVHAPGSAGTTRSKSTHRQVHAHTHTCACRRCVRKQAPSGARMAAQVQGKHLGQGRGAGGYPSQSCGAGATGSGPG